MYIEERDQRKEVCEMEKLIPHPDKNNNKMSCNMGSVPDPKTLGK